MKTLDLVLKKKWYDMIDSGVKTEEYREIKPYWFNRLVFLNEEDVYEFRRFDTVTFHLGYSKNRPSMTFKIKSIDMGEGREEWGAEKYIEYYIIRLGERIS